MNRRRVCTTISAKHWELLKKYTEKFETQQKVLEAALESLEKNSNRNHKLSLEEQFWMRTRELKSICLIQLDGLKTTMKAPAFEKAFELLAERKHMQHIIEYYYQKPLKDCNLKEIVDGLVIYARLSNWFDSVNYTDDGDHYTLQIYHSLGLGGSKFNRTFIENLFKTYGVKTESYISNRSNLIKIYKL
ncbi:MAG TPA: hypothetical protein VIO58_06210 [Candidatus Methanoperedens sp.]